MKQLKRQQLNENAPHKQTLKFMFIYKGARKIGNMGKGFRWSNIRRIKILPEIYVSEECSISSIQKYAGKQPIVRSSHFATQRNQEWSNQPSSLKDKEQS